MLLSNILLPFVSIMFIFKIDTETSPGLAVCLGEGYHNFFSTQYRYCKYDNTLAKVSCQFWFSLLAIFSSNVFDFYWMYSCIKKIKDETESTKDMTSQEAYIKRKRYLLRLLTTYRPRANNYRGLYCFKTGSSKEDSVLIPYIS